MPGMVIEHSPMLSTVSIMPGIDERAPERTDTSSGSAGSPNRLPMICSTLAIAAFASASRVEG